MTSRLHSHEVKILESNDFKITQPWGKDISQSQMTSRLHSHEVKILESNDFKITQPWGKDIRVKWLQDYTAMRWY